jgi:hypothetical protein
MFVVCVVAKICMYVCMYACMYLFILSFFVTKFKLCGISIKFKMKNVQDQD